MKKRIITIMLCLIFVAGCFPESTKIQTFTENTLQLSTAVDALQETTTEIIGTLADVNLVNTELVVKVDEANEEIDRVQSQTVDIATAIRDADYVSGDDIGNVIRAAKAGTAATAPWNPYATMIIIGLTLLEGVTALFLKKKSNEATASDKKYAAHKQGVEKSMKELNNEAEMKLYNNIGDARTHLGI